MKKSRVEEPEIVKSKMSKRDLAKGAALFAASRGGIKGAVASAATGFAMRSATGRIEGLKKRVMLVIGLYTAGILLGVTALISLVGWALFTVLPEWAAALILAIILLPIIVGIIIAFKTARSIWKHPFAKQVTKDTFNKFRK